jgi:hypothetical protein
MIDICVEHYDIVFYIVQCYKLQYLKLKEKYIELSSWNILYDAE